MGLIPAAVGKILSGENSFQDWFLQGNETENRGFSQVNTYQDLFALSDMDLYKYPLWQICSQERFNSGFTCPFLLGTKREQQVPPEIWISN